MNKQSREVDSQDDQCAAIWSLTNRMHVRGFVRAASVAALLIANLSAAEWLTFGHDAQRSGWATEETTLNPANAPKLGLKWKSKLKNESYRLSALTAPLMADDISTSRGVRSVVYVAGITGSVFALDALTGQEIWTHRFRPVVLPGKGGYQGTFLCPNGITATPVIDKSTSLIYVIAPDGALYGLDLGSGKARYGPVQFVAAYSKSWSLNLVDGVLYTVLAQGCGSGLSGFYAVDVHDPHRPMIRQLLLSNTNTAGMWGRGGPIIGANGLIYGQTADGKFDPAAGDYSMTVLSATLPDLKLRDYFLPLNWEYLNKVDLDLGSASPLFFGWRDRHLIASGAKEGVINLLDADQVGGADHETALYTTPKLANDENLCCVGHGIYGAMSTARDPEGQTWVYVPMGGKPSKSAPAFPITNGDTPHGSIMAFKVVPQGDRQNPVLEAAWISGDFDLPDPVVVANGLVIGLSTGENAVNKGGEEFRLTNTHPASLRVLDAKTGKELYNSGNAMESWVHFSGLAVADGQVFAVDHASNVYCFGLMAK